MLEILIYRTWAINFPVIHKRSLKNALTIVTESVTLMNYLTKLVSRVLLVSRPQVTEILETMGTSRSLLCDYFW